MKCRIGYFLIALFLLGGFSCKSTEEASNGKENGASSARKEEGSDPGAGFHPVIVDEEFEPFRKNGEFSADSLWVNKDTLILSISYSGGCEDHEFALYTTGRYTKTNPPGLQLYLRHEDNGDACRSLITKTLKFRMEELRYQASDSLVLSFHNIEKEVRYSY